MVGLTDSKLHVRLRFATGHCDGGVEIQVASGVATDLKVLLLAGFVLIGPDTRERRAGGCTVISGSTLAAVTLHAFSVLKQLIRSL